jgi:4-amino-4-deoxy-L-arabinose transferase-like glycosyltransferase
VSATTTFPAHAAATGRSRAGLYRLVRGREGDPRWVRPALLGLLALTALAYLFDLSRNGWANDFYAAAVQAGTKSWKAFFFGSFDSSNFITVDKTPASLWVMELSGRIFGVNYWSLLVPQALEGVASVGLLYAAVRRLSGPAAGLVAGLVMALTPVAVLMFRFNNPDALLVLLMTAAAYAMVRAIEAGRTKWLVLAGTLLGFAFLAKMLQAFLVVPGFALAYLWAGPPRLGKRIWQLLVAGGAILVSAGWWVLAAQLTPAADRPYFGGSTDNSILQLAIGYNGLGRLDGQETGSIGFNGSSAGGASSAASGAGHAASSAGHAASGAGHAVSGAGSAIAGSGRAASGAGRAIAGAGRAALGGATGGGGAGGAGGGGGGGFGGATGLQRLFASEFGGQVAWLLPAALLALVALLWLTRRAARTDRTRAAALIWGGWLLVTGLVFSYMSGIIHPYYMVALTPAIGALVGIGTVALWRARHGRLALAAGLAGTAIWAYVLLDRTPTWLPWLRWVVLLAGLTGSAAVAAWPRLAAMARSPRGRLALAGLPIACALVAGLGGPAAYAMDTISSAHTGSLPTAGPSGASLGGPGGGGGFGGAGSARGGPRSQSSTGSTGTGSTGTGSTGTGSTGTGSTGTGSTGTGSTGTGSTGTGGTGSAGAGLPSTPGGTRGTGGPPSGTSRPGGTGTGTGSSTGSTGTLPSRTGTGSTGSTGTGSAGAGGGMGGLSGNTQVSSALVKLLEAGASGYKWVAATEGSQEAAPLELATGGDPVMAIGGFNGTDPAPTLAEFKALVAKHEIHYYIGQNSESFGGGTNSSSIASWVAAHFKAQTVGGSTVYNLTEPKTT